MSSPDDLLRAWQPSPKLPPMDPNPHDAASPRACSSIEVRAAPGIMNARSRACGVGPGRRSIVDRVDRLLLERALGQGRAAANARRDNSACRAAIDCEREHLASVRL
jgi:hypothetical protein